MLCFWHHSTEKLMAKLCSISLKFIAKQVLEPMLEKLKKPKKVVKSINL